MTATSATTHIASNSARTLELRLEAGSNLLITPDQGPVRVSCEGQSNRQGTDLPTCRIVKMPNYYEIYLGQDSMGQFYAYKDAIERIKDLKSNELCR